MSFALYIVGLAVLVGGIAIDARRARRPLEAAPATPADDVAEPARPTVRHVGEDPLQVAARFDPTDHLTTQRHVLEHDIGVHEVGGGRRSRGRRSARCARDTRRRDSRARRAP